MTVKQDDFGDLFTGNLAFTPEAQHVLCVVAFIQVAHAGVTGKKRMAKRMGHSFDYINGKAIPPEGSTAF